MANFAIILIQGMHSNVLLYYNQKDIMILPTICSILASI